LSQIKRIVDFKMNNPLTGHVITTAISSLRYIQCDEIWQITRVNSDIEGTIWIPQLAPSPALFNKHQHEWKENPPEIWWPLYEDRFNEELKTEEKLGALRRLWRSVEAGKSIALACFCPNPRYCHRRLVGLFLEWQGVNVVEFDVRSIRNDSPQQQDLFG
jgi:uncharacterized protein YeaO (DUF488 family)